MKNKIKIFNLAFLSISFLFALFIFTEAQISSGAIAQINPLQLPEEPYGGERLVTIECDCSRGISYLIIDEYATGRIVKFLYVRGSSVIYEYYMPTTATYLLGSYKKSQTQCKVNTKSGCVVLPDNGTLGSAPGTGTSY